MISIIEQKLERLKQSKEYRVIELHSQGLTNEEIANITHYKTCNIRAVLTKHSLSSNLYKSIEETHELTQLIIGSILGDGSLSKIEGSKRHSRLRIAHCLEQEDYCKWKSDILKKHDLLASIKYCHTFDTRFKDPDYTLIKLSSFSHPIITKYREFFYPNNKTKSIVMSEVEKIEALGLAIWFMDDGTRTKYSMALYTNSFTLDELLPLVNFLKLKFDLEFTLQKSSVLYLKTRSWNRFRELVSPYIVPCMQYKIRT